MEEAILLLAAAVDEGRGIRLEKRALRDASNPYELPDEVFTMLFRISKDNVRYICDSLRDNLQRQRSHGLSVESQVFASLRFFAVGSYQLCVGQDFLISMSQPSVSRCIQAVALAIRENLTHQWIKFPSTLQERNTNKQSFRAMRNIKGVIGCIDCTHVAIVRPSEHEEAYVNHKGYHSLNVQAICSPNMKFMNINARYPGSVHDAFIWRHSAAREEMVRCWDLGDHSSWLLGDSGYPLEPWLITPVLHAADGTPEARFTEAHVQTRCCVERAFGVLKNAFRCLMQHRTLHYQPLQAASIVVACATLHNIRVEGHLGNAPIDFHDDMEVDIPRELNEGAVDEAPPLDPGERHGEAVRVRNLLIRNFQH